MATFWANPTTRIAIILLTVAGVLESAICVAAHSLGRRQADAALAKVKSEADKSHTDESQRLTRPKPKRPIFPALERGTRETRRACRKTGGGREELLKLRADRDAANKQISELTRNTKPASRKRKTRPRRVAKRKKGPVFGPRKRGVRRLPRPSRPRGSRPSPPTPSMAKRKGPARNGKNNQAAAWGRGQRTLLPRTSPSFATWTRP